MENAVTFQFDMAKRRCFPKISFSSKLEYTVSRIWNTRINNVWVEYSASTIEVHCGKRNKVIYCACLLYLRGQNMTHNLEFLTFCRKARRQGMVVSIVTMQWAGLDDPGLDLRQVQEIFIFYKTSRSALGSIQPPAQCLLAFFPRGKLARAWCKPNLRLLPSLRMNRAIRNSSPPMSPYSLGQGQLYHYAFARNLQHRRCVITLIIHNCSCQSPSLNIWYVSRSNTVRS
jgi:hypothetical protein